jgi:hypothetical protein
MPHSHKQHVKLFQVYLTRGTTNLSLSNVRLGDSALLAALSIFVTGFCSNSVIPQAFRQSFL